MLRHNETSETGCRIRRQGDIATSIHRANKHPSKTKRLTGAPQGCRFHPRRRSRGRAARLSVKTSVVFFSVLLSRLLLLSRIPKGHCSQRKNQQVPFSQRPMPPPPGAPPPRPPPRPMDDEPVDEEPMDEFESDLQSLKQNLDATNAKTTA